VKKRIGILALQGDFEAHGKALEDSGAEPRTVKTSADLAGLDGLVVPGGESTTLLKLARWSGMLTPLREFARRGNPVFGTCAGLILLAARTLNPEQESLGLIDLVAYRNGYGSQKDSFEAETSIPVLGEEPFPLVFIRAPVVMEAGSGVDSLAIYDGRIVLARQANVLVATFHPELTEDLRLHKYFLGMVEQKVPPSAERVSRKETLSVLPLRKSRPGA